MPAATTLEDSHIASRGQALLTADWREENRNVQPVAVAINALRSKATGAKIRRGVPLMRANNWGLNWLTTKRSQTVSSPIFIGPRNQSIASIRDWTAFKWRNSIKGKRQRVYNQISHAANQLLEELKAEVVLREPLMLFFVHGHIKKLLAL